MDVIRGGRVRRRQGIINGIQLFIITQEEEVELTLEADMLREKNLATFKAKTFVAAFIYYARVKYHKTRDHGVGGKDDEKGKVWGMAATGQVKEKWSGEGLLGFKVSPV